MASIRCVSFINAHMLFYVCILSCKFWTRRNLVHHWYKATSLPRIIKKILYLRIKLWKLFYTPICSYFYLSEHFDYPLLSDSQHYSYWFIIQVDVCFAHIFYIARLHSYRSNIGLWLKNDRSILNPCVTRSSNDNILYSSTFA